MNKLVKSYKIMLHPNNSQQMLMNKSFGLARFIYNWCLEQQISNHKLGNKFINKYELKKLAIRLKDRDEYLWMKELPAKIIHQAVFDADNAYKNFFSKKSKFPNFKSKRKSKKSFWNPPDSIKFTENKVLIQKIGWIKLAEKDRIPVNTKYYNPRISFDGLNYWLSIGVKCENQTLNTPITEPIGIDLGIKTLITVSNGDTYHRIKVDRQTKKLKRLQRQASRLYIKYKGKDKSKNLLKLEKQILKQHQRITNIQMDNIHKIISKLVKSNPSFISIEDLNVSGMMKNRHLSRVLNECKFYEIRRQLEYKSELHNIDLVIIDRWYPSSKTCSNCGNIKKDLKLSGRIYTCECGLSMNRDLNASINIRNQGNLLKKKGK